VDVTVLGDPDPIARELARVTRGTLVPLGRGCESAFRVVARSHDGGRWVLDLVGARDSVCRDLARRDFTIDAMALPLDAWREPFPADRVIDPFHGRDDLALGLVRVVSASAFSEDPIRLLRAVRLAARMGFAIEPGTARLISQQAGLVSSCPGERVRDELLHILRLDGAKVHLELLDGLGLLCCIIPELAMSKGVQQPREHFWDVFGHSLNTVAGVESVTSGGRVGPVVLAVPWTPELGERFATEVSDGHSRRTLLKLAGLLHDIAKPQTRTVDSGGRTRFFRHHTVGAAMAREILGRLRVSNRGVEMVSGMVESHLRPTQMCQGGELPTARAIYRYFRDVGDVAVDTLYLSLADHLAARGPQLEMEGWERHVGMVAHVLHTGTRQPPEGKTARLVTGHDLISTFGLTPGPALGVILEGLREAEAAGEVETREAALAWAGQRLDELSGEHGG
jgi:poly(A) polymerase